MIRYLFLVFVLTLSSGITAQSFRALFLGNSYTHFNDLPGMVVDIAHSMGDSLITDQNTPGGYTLQLHASTSGSLSKVYRGGWDFVVLQEQSQLPSLPITQVQYDVFFFAEVLDSVIHAHSPCARTTFYMTWGRKNGDASNCVSWPPVCTYQGMDNLLRQRYMTMTSDNNAQVSPVGALWRYIRKNYPNIELYAGDGSHPSLAGSYAAACAFYTVFFQKEPRHITFNSTLSQAVADSIKVATKRVVFDSLHYWMVDTNNLEVNFSHFQETGLTYRFDGRLENAASYKWFIEDTVYHTLNPLHTFKNEGLHRVIFQAYGNGGCDTVSSVKYVNVVISGLDDPAVNHALKIYPNPNRGRFTIDMGIDSEGVIKLLSPDGRLVHELSFRNEDKLELDLLGSIPRGIYLIQVISGDKFYREKLVLE